jgi:hypothetical protein
VGQSQRQNQRRRIMMIAPTTNPSHAVETIARAANVDAMMVNGLSDETTPGQRVWLRAKKTPAAKNVIDTRTAQRTQEVREGLAGPFKSGVSRLRQTGTM